MFDNVGNKIKIIAKAFCYIGMFSSIISGIYIMSLGESLILLGLLIPVIGCLFSWIMSLFTYGFGELISNTTVNVSLDDTNNLHKNKENKTIEERNKLKVIINNDKIKDNEYIDIECPNCNETLSYMKQHIINNTELICPMCDYKIDISIKKIRD